jgi:ABC-type multidrug transport system ATPase subunit
VEEAERLCDRVAIIDHGRIESLPPMLQTVACALTITYAVPLL